MCGARELLQVHHIGYRYLYHEDAHPETLMTLCDTCHEQVTKYFHECAVLRSAAGAEGKKHGRDF